MEGYKRGSLEVRKLKMSKYWIVITVKWKRGLNSPHFAYVHKCINKASIQFRTTLLAYFPSEGNLTTKRGGTPKLSEASVTSRGFCTLSRSASHRRCWTRPWRWSNWTNDCHHSVLCPPSRKWTLQQLALDSWEGDSVTAAFLHKITQHSTCPLKTYLCI